MIRPFHIFLITSQTRPGAYRALRHTRRNADGA